MVLLKEAYSGRHGHRTREMWRKIAWETSGGIQVFVEVESHGDYGQARTRANHMYISLFGFHFSDKDSTILLPWNFKWLNRSINCFLHNNSVYTCILLFYFFILFYLFSLLLVFIVNKLQNTRSRISGEKNFFLIFSHMKWIGINEQETQTASRA